MRAPPRRGTVDLQKRHSAKTWRMSAQPSRSCVSSTCYQDEPAAQTNCGYEVRWSAPRWACADAVRRVIAARWTHPAAQELPWWRRPQGLATPCQCRTRQAPRATPPDTRARHYACNPRGTHIRVAHSVEPQDAKRYGVGCERRGADCAHRDRARQRPLYCMPDNRRNYPKAERTHAHALGEGCHGAVAQCHSTTSRLIP